MPESDDLQPVSRESTAGFIAGQIRLGIMNGTFPPGAQLGEADLASRFEVSRGPLREAMQRLVQEGLLYSERHRGLFVATLGTDDIADVYLARSVVERAAVREIVRRADADDLQPLEHAVRDMETAVSDSEWLAVADADLAFHEALVAASGSPRLVQMNSTLLVETRMCLPTIEPLALETGIAGEHRGILQVLQARDEGAALKLLDAHMDEARVRRVRLATQVSGPAAEPGKR